MRPDQDPAAAPSSTNPSDRPTDLPPKLDPFLLDHDRIQALAPAELVSAGLRHFKEDRVTEIGIDGERLWASVEDAQTEDTVDVQLTFDGDGRLVSDCTCPAPADAHCVHALAALFAWAGRAGERELLGAAEGAIEERVRRGRTEVRATQLSGEPGFGAWTARSIVSESYFPTSYRVHIRSLHRRANYCTCPDFATNQLGTCKHIEAVLYQIGKRRDFAQIKDQPPASPFVYLDWESDPAPQIRLNRATLGAGTGDEDLS